MDFFFAFNNVSRALTGNDIVSITDDSTKALITTAAPHGLSGSESVIITGTSVYDGTYVNGVASISSPTVFALDTSYVSDTYGGRWALV